MEFERADRIFMLYIEHTNCPMLCQKGNGYVIYDKYLTARLNREYQNIPL